MGNVLEEGAASWSLLQQLESSLSCKEYYAGAASVLGFGAGTSQQHSGSVSGAWGGLQKFVFHGDPTPLTGTAKGRWNRIGVLASGAGATKGNLPF